MGGREEVAVKIRLEVVQVEGMKRARALRWKVRTSGLRKGSHLPTN